MCFGEVEYEVRIKWIFVKLIVVYCFFFLVEGRLLGRLVWSFLKKVRGIGLVVLGDGSIDFLLVVFDILLRDFLLLLF